ncbi:MAG: hypothetical protein RL326_1967 [Pseudomonadota bacterium]
MQTPIPTPFDIISPPPAPWVPTTYAWLVLLSALVLAYWWIRRLGRKRRAPAVEQIIRGLESELTHATTQDPLRLERVCRLAKRLIAFYIPQDLTGLTSPETRMVAEALRKGDDRSRSAAQIVELLAAIEDREYAPKDSSPESALLTDVNNLTAALATHTRRYKPS